MIDDVMKSAIGLLACGLVTFVAVKNRHAIYEAIGITPQASDLATQEVRVLTPTSEVKSKQSGGSIALKKNPQDGQFWADVRVNNKKISMLVDTGASAIALTPEDAKRAGVKTKTLKYNIPVNTAGGKVMAASTTLKSVKVGPIKIKEVRAMVIPEGLHISLLGMTYLGQVRKIEVSSGKMVLKN